MRQQKNGQRVLFSDRSQKRRLVSGRKRSGASGAYSEPLSRLRLKRSRKKLLGLVLGLGLLLSLFSYASFHKYSLVRQTKAVGPESDTLQENASQHAEALPLTIAAGTQEPFPQELGKKAASRKPGGVEVGEKNSVSTQYFRVHSGDTATSILSDYLSPSQIYLLSRECRDVYPLKGIKTGHEYRLLFREDRLSGFEYDIDDETKLHVAIQDGAFRARKEKIDYATQDKLIRGRIGSSLFQAVEKAGGTASLAISLAQIFAWDIDFIRDVREGDSFRILVSERYRRDEFVGYGKIKAARFVNRDKEFNAFLYQTRKGREEYFDEQGRAMRKTFLKAPLNFTRISSGYTWHRKHPILDKVRPHLGIDYAAPSGTPIKSVAKGRVIVKDYSSGAGHYLKIRHPNGYVSVYNHMSRYARGIRPGTKLKQGDVVGYVGSTGLSTGPHLDYRVKRYGKYINPRKIDSKPVRSVPDPEMPAFRRTIRPLRAALDQEGAELAVLSRD